MNLKNVDIDKLSTLPFKQKMCERTSTGLKVYNLGWYKRNHHKGEYDYNKISRIVSGSVGKHRSTIERKVRPLLHRNKTLELLHYILDLDDCSNELQRYRGDYYYFENNYLNYKESTLWKSAKLKISREQQHKNVRNRKEIKRYTSFLSIISLNFINNPTLYSFYVNLIDEIKSYENTLNKSPKPLNSTNEQNIWIRWSNRRLVEDKIKAKRELPKLKEDLLSLIDGDLSCFYRCKTYLHSLGKECHHF